MGKGMGYSKGLGTMGKGMDHSKPGSVASIEASYGTCPKFELYYIPFGQLLHYTNQQTMYASPKLMQKREITRFSKARKRRVCTILARSGHGRWHPNGFHSEFYAWIYKGQ